MLSSTFIVYVCKPAEVFAERLEESPHGRQCLPGCHKVIIDDDVGLFGQHIKFKNRIHSLLGVAECHILVERNLQHLAQSLADQRRKILDLVAPFRRGADAPVTILQLRPVP